MEQPAIPGWRTISFCFFYFFCHKTKIMFLILLKEPDNFTIFNFI